MKSTDLISFSFCQISDLKLDSSASVRLNLSPAQRQERREETLEALAKAIKKARELAVDAVLVPGNVFSDNLRTATIAAVQEIFASLNETPVFIASGAEDPSGRESPYDEVCLKARGLKNWSENIRFFKQSAVETVSLKTKASVRLSGFAFQKEGSGQELVPELNQDERSALNLLLLPQGGAEISQEKQALLCEKLEENGFSYAAVSGCQNGLTLEHNKGKIAGAATGTFVGQSRLESGPRQVIFGELSRKLSEEKASVSLSFEEFDPRRIYCPVVDLSNKIPQECQSEILKCIRESGAREGKDIIVLRLQGQFISGHESFSLFDELRSSYYQVLLEDHSRPDFLLKLKANRQFESNFIKIMDDLKVKSSGTLDDSIIEDALYFGLQALREGKVSIRHAD